MVGQRSRAGRPMPMACSADFYQMLRPCVSSPLKNSLPAYTMRSTIAQHWQKQQVFQLGNQPEKGSGYAVKSHGG